MHIHHLALRVRDFEKSLHFYQTLTELKIHTQFSANGGSIAYLQNASGETQLELIGMPAGETVKEKHQTFRQKQTKTRGKTARKRKKMHKVSGGGCSKRRIVAILTKEDIRKCRAGNAAG